MFLFEVKVLIWSALEIEFFELYFLQPVLLLLFLFIYFFFTALLGAPLVIYNMNL